MEHRMDDSTTTRSTIFDVYVNLLCHEQVIAAFKYSSPDCFWLAFPRCLVNQ